MPMLGDDVIAILHVPESHRLRFLKAEAKSRSRLTPQVLADARAQLDEDGGLPSPPTLAYISARLFEIGDLRLVDAIDDALREHGIRTEDVRHLLFTFSGNAPDRPLTKSLQNYVGTIKQWGVGLQVEDHAEFVAAVYEQVMTNANNP